MRTHLTRNKLILISVPIVAVAIFICYCIYSCVGCYTNRQTTSDTTEVVSEIILMPETLEDDELWQRSCQTVDAHDEQDTIFGNFTGKGIDTLFVEMVSPAPSDTTSNHLLDTHFYIASTNKKIPKVEIIGVIQTPPKLVNEGDLDGNGTCEVGYLPTWVNSQWRWYRILTFHNGEWRYLIDGDYCETAEWFRHSGAEVAEPGPRKGTVLVHYGVELKSIIKDTIVQATYSKITDIED